MDGFYRRMGHDCCRKPGGTKLNAEPWQHEAFRNGCRELRQLVNLYRPARNTDELVWPAVEALDLLGSLRATQGPRGRYRMRSLVDVCQVCERCRRNSTAPGVYRIARYVAFPPVTMLTASTPATVSALTRFRRTFHAACDGEPSP